MENAPLYAHSNSLQKRDALMVMKEFLPRMSWELDAEFLLDVGCGSGDVTRNLLMPLLPSSVERIVGVDVSEEMVNYAAKHFEHNRIEYLPVDIQNMTNPLQIFPRGFTKVTSFYCLHWVRDQMRCLENIYALLQDGGEALLVFLASNPIFTMYENMSQKEIWKDYMKDVSNYVPVQQHKQFPEVDFEALVEDVGYEVLHCESREMKYAFENINQLRAAIQAVNPFLKEIPQNMRSNFIGDCLRELISMSPEDESGSTLAKYSILVCYLRKPY